MVVGGWTKTKLMLFSIQVEVVVELKLEFKLVTTSPGGWTKTKLMLFSTQVEVVVELKLELSLAICILRCVSKWVNIFSNSNMS